MKIKCISKSLISLIVAFALFLGAGIMALTNLTSKPTNRVSAAAQTIEGSSVTWEYNSSTHELTIAGAGDMPNFEYGETPWWSIREEVQVVNIGPYVTKIGRAAFQEFVGITSISLPYTLTNGIGRESGCCCFSGCSNLANVYWDIPSCPDFDGGDGVFDYCGTEVTEGLTITFGPNVTYIPADLFSNDETPANLTSVVLGDNVSGLGVDGYSEWGYYGYHPFEWQDSNITSFSVLSGSYGETWARAAGYTEPVLVVRPASGGEDTGVIANIVLPTILAVTLVSVIAMYALIFKRHKHI